MATNGCLSWIRRQYQGLHPILVRILVLLFTLPCPGQPTHPWLYPYCPRNKKYIEYGWDMPTARYVAAHISSIETQPFDGLVMSPGNSVVNLFNPADWTGSIDTTSLRAIHWNKFTTNFLDLHSNDSYGMDYFNDAQWKQITANANALAMAAKRYGFRGIFWDIESYTALSPWNAADNRHGHTLATLRAEVFLRGSQFMQALQTAYPKITVYIDYLETSSSDNTGKYALLANFANGMLSVIGRGVLLVNGQEWSYFSGDTKYWFSSYDQSKTALRGQLVNPAYYDVWAAQVGVGKATYDAEALTLSPALTQAQRAQMIEHNVYMGLVTADEITWGYFEMMNWWGNTGRDQVMGYNVTKSPPAWLKSAIITARKIYASGSELGFDWVGGSIDGGGGLPDSSVKVSLMRSGSVVSAGSSVPGSEIIRSEIWMNMVLKMTSRTASLSFDLSTLTQGSYDIVARAYSADGSTGTSKVLTAVVARQKVQNHSVHKN